MLELTEPQYHIFSFLNEARQRFLFYTAIRIYKIHEEKANDSRSQFTGVRPHKRFSFFAVLIFYCLKKKLI